MSSESGNYSNPEKEDGGTNRISSPSPTSPTSPHPRDVDPPNDTAAGMEPIPEEHSYSDTSLDVTLGMMYTGLPPVKFHDVPLQFWSRSRVSASQYERRLSAASSTSSSSSCTSEEDLLTIRCPNGKSLPSTFRITATALARSPAFNAFFKSKYYAPSSDTLITFTIDPAASFDLIQRYLQAGPDIFDINRLRLHVYRRYTIIERETVLVRLARMANAMGLGYLHEMVYEILLDESRFITAQVLPLLAGLIFSPGSYYHGKIKEWCLVNIGHHFLELKSLRMWANCLRVSEPALRDEWRHMASLNDEILYTYENISDEQILERKFKRMSTLEQDRVISYLGEKRAQDESNELVREESVSRVQGRNEADGDLDTTMEDLLLLHTPIDLPPSPSTSSSTSTSSPAKDHHTTTATANAKAIGMMGMYEHSELPHSNTNTTNTNNINPISNNSNFSPRGKKLKRKRGMISSLLGSPSILSTARDRELLDPKNNGSPTLHSASSPRKIGFSDVVTPWERQEEGELV